jgi:hypothetical protein
LEQVAVVLDQMVLVALELQVVEVAEHLMATTLLV